MPVIDFNAAAGRRAYALLQDDLKDWKLAHDISLSKDGDTWKAALEKLLLETDEEYSKLISGRARVCYDNRQAKTTERLDASTKALKKNFKTGPGRKYRPPASKSVAAGAVASILSNLSEGVTA